MYAKDLLYEVDRVLMSVLLLTGMAGTGIVLSKCFCIVRVGFILG